MRAVILFALSVFLFLGTASAENLRANGYSSKTKFFPGRWFADVTLESNCYAADGCTAYQSKESGVDMYTVKLRMIKKDGIPTLTGSIKTRSLVTGNEIFLKKLSSQYDSQGILFYKYLTPTTYQGVCIVPREQVYLMVESIAEKTVTAIHRVDWVQCNKHNTEYFSHIYTGPGDKIVRTPTLWY